MGFADSGLLGLLGEVRGCQLVLQRIDGVAEMRPGVLNLRAGRRDRVIRVTGANRTGPVRRHELTFFFEFVFHKILLVP